MTRYIPPNEDWRLKANCRKVDTNIFFPLKTTHATVAEAYSYCKACTVKIDCLHSAVRYDYDGIWAGSTRGQRDYILNTVMHNRSRELFTLADAEQMIEEMKVVSVRVASSRRKKKNFDS